MFSLGTGTGEPGTSLQRGFVSCSGVLAPKEQQGILCPSLYPISKRVADMGICGCALPVSGHGQGETRVVLPGCCLSAAFPVRFQFPGKEN